MQKYNHIGEHVLQNCGMECEIIEYISAATVTVRFTDGTIVKNMRYYSFLHGGIKNPKIVVNHIGERYKNNAGLWFTIVDYKGSNFCTIKFDDGVIVENKTYYLLKKGIALHPNQVYILSQRLIGEESISTCGEKMTIIALRNKSDIDVQFEDGTIVNHKSYCNFKKGSIGKSNTRAEYYRKFAEKRWEDKFKAERTGIKVYQSNWDQYAEIIEYNRSNNITLRLEDGTILTNREFTAFKRGLTPNPARRSAILKTIRGSNNKNFKDRTGEVTYNSYTGEKMEIVKYNSAKDIMIRFEDGTEIKTAYKSFKNGTASNPNFIRNHVGETCEMACLMKATVINQFYKKQSKGGQNLRVDIQFEDGTVVRNKSYQHFKKGKVGNPSLSRKEVTKRLKTLKYLNATIMQNCGLYAKIDNYVTADDVRVVFEDGEISETHYLNCFLEGSSSHPKLSKRNSVNYMGFACKRAYKEENNVFYNCRCNKCGYEDILTPQQMIQHHKKCN